MNLLLAAATPFEIQPLLDHLSTEFDKEADYHFKKDDFQAHVLITGVGMMSTAFSLGHILATNQYDLVINAGIAGVFNRSIEIGEVVQVTSERFGDLGVEEKDGAFTDLFQLGLVDGNQPPFENGLIKNDTPAGFDFLRKCSAITVNKVHGAATSIKAIEQKYPVDIETMEGGAFFYACKFSEIPFLQIRSISNYVEPRNRENWNLPLAIHNLNHVLIEMVSVFTNPKA